MKKLKIFILSTDSPSRKLIRAIDSKNHTWERYSPKELYLIVSDTKNGKDRLFAEIEGEKPKELFAKDFDAVITRSGGGSDYSLTVLQHLTDNIGLYCPQRAGSIRIAANKMWTTQKASAAGLNSPVTVFAENAKNIPFLVSQVDGYPFVLKTPYGSQGKGVVKMVDEQQAVSTIELLDNQKVDTLFQAYIPSGGTDYRAIVVGNNVVCGMQRTAKDGFKSNLSQGGTGVKVELTEANKKFCVDASKAVGLQFSGVDIMLSNKDGKTYLIEVNSNPGTGIIDVCQYNFFNDLVELVEQEVEAKNKKVAITGMTAEALYSEMYYSRNSPESHLSNEMPDREKFVLSEMYRRGKSTDATVIAPTTSIEEKAVKTIGYVKNPLTEKRNVQYVQE